jgi:hypothetical protein
MVANSFGVCRRQNNIYGKAIFSVNDYAMKYHNNFEVEPNGDTYIYNSFGDYLKITAAEHSPPTGTGNSSMEISSSNHVISFKGESVYNTLVCGKIWALDEVVAQTSNPWPDYVFNTDYNLKPLSELEQYINLNKHLPGISSADDIKKEGVKLAETSSEMLRKIEELTLYIIQQNKEMDELKGRITNLEKR